MLKPRLILDWTLYRLALLVAAPLIPLRLLWRGRRERGYWRNWRERLGGGPVPAAQSLWVHAVSVGEMRAAQPLIAALREAHPDWPVLLTCMTPTGRATAEALYGEFAHIAYLPYDYAWPVRRFLRRARPRVGILMETELWPNLVRAAAAANVPLMLANGRLSERSAKGYAKLPALTRASLQRLAIVAAQTEADAARLLRLGASAARVTGNLKFDIAPPPALLERGAAWKAAWHGRPVLLAASTREGEEAALLHAFAAADADVLLVLVPRHPQRFEEVAGLIAAAGLRYQRRSELDRDPLAAATRVVLGDSLGELFAYYAACDVAFVGGSLVPLGGQNLIEAASVGRPILVGPYTFNFDEAARLAIAAGAALRVGDAAEWMRESLRLLRDGATRERMGEAGRAFAAQHRGAAARVTGLVPV
ncbi:probable 3-deoxy-D-manno-octulosonic-acid transferase transmembrane protein [Thiobacillus denitrificans ATCC 25259]|uniref:3-deoxy-D-manno-octulosonic acid transferase n=1 Tax=Thiobacillus denitrificans (strain ATCC 25259 / T1) TaxID=292415 RepID=Q3SFF9_THIDA|nr:lipid IV(A) 3-deoxy-D-manno-octulosonic acid transferase [Thiobacillus denitrificans]AAZ98651.1 probable 3-deoxy-D-manno-octulosonic-acid transferase transmembrane protein [Thiobacillus denitrificans ATCC 25259]